MTKEERLAADGAINPIIFFGREPDWGFLSNFTYGPIFLPHPFRHQVVMYPTVEHRFQAMKATTDADHDAVMLNETPGDAKAAGRGIQLRPDWGETHGSVCWLVMVEALLARTIQHEAVGKALLASGDRWIYEDSPTDNIWGWRRDEDYSGTNLLGLAWMHVRSIHRGGWLGRFQRTDQ